MNRGENIGSVECIVLFLLFSHKRSFSSQYLTGNHNPSPPKPRKKVRMDFAKELSFIVSVEYLDLIIMN